MIQDALMFFLGAWCGVIIAFFSAALLAERLRKEAKWQQNEMDADDPYLARTRVYQGNETKEI